MFKKLIFWSFAVSFLQTLTGGFSFLEHTIQLKETWARVLFHALACTHAVLWLVLVIRALSLPRTHCGLHLPQSSKAAKVWFYLWISFLGLIEIFWICLDAFHQKYFFNYCFFTPLHLESELHMWRPFHDVPCVTYTHFCIVYFFPFLCINLDLFYSFH